MVSNFELVRVQNICCTTIGKQIRNWFAIKMSFFCNMNVRIDDGYLLTLPMTNENTSTITPDVVK